MEGPRGVQATVLLLLLRRRAGRRRAVGENIEYFFPFLFLFSSLHFFSVYYFSYLLKVKLITGIYFNFRYYYTPFGALVTVAMLSIKVKFWYRRGESR